MHAMAFVELGQPIKDELPVPFDIEVRIGWPCQDRVGTGDDRNFGEVGKMDKRKFGICLANIDDGDVLAGHGIWKTGVSGTATGSLSAWVSITSAI